LIINIFEEASMKKIIAKHALIPIVAGIVTIVAVVCFERRYLPPEPVTGQSILYSLLPYSTKFLDHLGIAFLSLGVIGVILEIPHLHDYFYGLFVDALTDPRYVQERKKDNNEWIKRQQTKLMAGLFGRDIKMADLFAKDIEKPGSFFNYYFDRIQRFIGEPYRDETTGITRIAYDQNHANFIVTEEISFNCRKLGEEIQKKTSWTAERDELIDMLAFKISVTPPASLNADRDLKPETYEWDFDNPPTDSPLVPVTPSWGFEMPLEKYRGIDGLTVKTEVTYVVALDRAFSWWMPYISKGLKCEIKYPNDLTIFVDRFILDDSIMPDTSTPGECKFTYTDWLLPRNGLAFHFRKIT
jgi:hypothetical protein